MFKADIKGLNEVLRNIEKYDKLLSDGLDEELSDAANNVALMARAKAPPGRTGQLASSIIPNTGTRFIKFVTVSAFYAPYVEFGTGIRVFKTPAFNFTPEMRAYAREFYVSGLGKEFPQPYLFPSFELEKVRLMQRIKALFFKDIRL